MGRCFSGWQPIESLARQASAKCAQTYWSQLVHLCVPGVTEGPKRPFHVTWSYAEPSTSAPCSDDPSGSLPVLNQVRWAFLSERIGASLSFCCSPTPLIPHGVLMSLFSLSEHSSSSCYCFCPLRAMTEAIRSSAYTSLRAFCTSSCEALRCPGFHLTDCSWLDYSHTKALYMKFRGAGALSSPIKLQTWLMLIMCLNP